MTIMGEAEYALPQAGLLIGEKRLLRASGGVHAHVFAADGQVQAEVPIAGADEVNRAVEAAHAALPGWKSTKPSIRRDLLFKLADLVERHCEELAWVGAREVGSPISGVRAIPGKFSAWTKYAAGWADKLEGRVVSSLQDDSVFDYTLSEPYGVIGMVITWNGPLMGLGMKVGPALAAGNTIVLKPPELTPFTAWRVTQLAEEAGFPPGVINLVTGGVEAGEALINHPKVAKVAFTGGLSTGKRIAGQLAAQMKPGIFELGGKSANLVFADADLEKAAKHSARTPLFLSGQGCVLPTRLLVEEAIANAFVDRVIAEIASLRIGDPQKDETEFGPVVSAAAQARLIGLIEEARRRGDGGLALGGGKPEGLEDGFYVAPTVFTGVDPTSSLAQNECFGPVLSIITFKDEEDAIRIANNTAFGLGAFVHSQNIARVNRLVHALDAGTVQVNGAPTARENAPFGGNWLSGYGREGGYAGLSEYIRVKNVAIA